MSVWTKLAALLPPRPPGQYDDPVKNRLGFLTERRRAADREADDHWIKSREAAAAGDHRASDYHFGRGMAAINRSVAYSDMVTELRMKGKSDVE